MIHSDMLVELHRLQDEAQAAAAEFMSVHAQTVEPYRAEISVGLQQVLDRLRADVRAVSGGNKVCEELTAQAAQYVDWLQWSLWDLPYFAVALRPSAPCFRNAVAACAQVYLAIRIFDDVIDHHFWYKGRHPTLLASTSENYRGDGAEALTILGGLLLCFDGLLNLNQSDLQPMLAPVIRAIRYTIIGMVMEHSAPSDWNRDYYDRLAQLKNVEYWRSLYAALDPTYASPLYPFLEKYYALAQNLNDVQDFAEDQQKGQPNLLSLYLSETLPPSLSGSADSTPASVAPSDVEQLLADKFLALAAMAKQLPQLERSIALLKLSESLNAAYRFGLFKAQAEQTAPIKPAPKLGLHWYATIAELIERVGADGLETVNCAVCGSADRHYLFRKQGFAFHRCLECSHIYVSPRIKPELQAQLGDELDEADLENVYLEVQKMYAVAICQRLRMRAPGNRLLDIGFGRGYVMQMAQAYGFEVYGIDSSAAQTSRVWPQFGKKVYQALMGDKQIPWNSFDVVVMSHVVEHLPDPAETLGQVRAAMNPRAILYVAVPDSGSLAFQIFGKKWDVINPLVHYQYFNAVSLARLLSRCGFAGRERIQHPAMTEELAPRWIQLMRRFGGNDSNELAVLAWNTDGE